ncbi:Uncharacterised protein [Brucella melitensis]|nr:Uncharacterised protein [Brucella melitensis]
MKLWFFRFEQVQRYAPASIVLVFQRDDAPLNACGNARTEHRRRPALRLEFACNKAQLQRERKGKQLRRHEMFSRNNPHTRNQDQHGQKRRP